MSTAKQLTDQMQWDQIEANLAKALGGRDESRLLELAGELAIAGNGVADLACFAVMYELHRRTQAGE